MKTITVTNLQAKSVTRKGVTLTPRIAYHHNAEIVPGVSIRLYGLGGAQIGSTGNESYDRTFKIGDTAEYHAYNIHYLGKIVAITEKTVSIEEENGTKHRLELYDFDRRNHDLDLASIAIRNADQLACC